jgi:hypothetical protein
MKIKQILARARKHWFVLSLILAVLIVSTVMNSGGHKLSGPILFDDFGVYPERSLTVGVPAVAREILPSPPYYGDGNFYSEIEDRQIEKDAYIAVETKTGKFHDAEEELKLIVMATDSFILNENVNKYGEIYHGNYNVKVKNEKYDFFVQQARNLGKVISFNDNARDVTGELLNLDARIVQETVVLNDLIEILDETVDEKEKNKLRERISSQRRYINNLQKQLENRENNVEYSTININLREAQPKFYGEFVGFDDLINKLVRSFNSLLRWVVGVLPWAVLGFLVWLAVRLIKTKF